MQTYEFKTAEFQGPLDKLLELIEGKDMEISKVNLADITADFLTHIKSIQNIHPKILSDFVAVASKLILIKSHTLLPNLELTKEEETEIKDFEDRLKLYKEFKEAEKEVENLWAKKVSYSRDFFLDTKDNGFIFSQALTANDLKKIVEKVVGELTVVFPKMEEGSIKLISFEEKMGELLERITKTISASFREVSAGKNRTEIVVTFLAILHLLKDSLIKVEQANEFEDIRISKHSGEQKSN